MEIQEDRKHVPVIIMDPGTWKIKIGFATDDLPTFEMPCIYIEKEMTNSKIVKFGYDAIEEYTLIKYGHNKYNKAKNDESTKDEQLVNVNTVFADPRHPLSNNQYPHLLEVYNHLIKKLNINTCDYHLLVIIPEMVEKLYATNLLNWAFKIHDFCSISFIYNSLAASYYYGLRTALVVDLGESASRIIPVAENNGTFLEFAKISEINGYLISNYISNFVKINDNYIDYILIQDYKESNSYVSLDIDNNIKILTECNGIIKPYKIPYNNNIYIDPKGEILSHEIYFKPEFLAHLPGNFYKQNIISLSQLIFEAISSCPIDLRKVLLNNIILVGGVSNCINMPDRLHIELNKILRVKNFSENTRISIKHIRMADIASYLGGKKYAKIIYSNQKKWITKNEYFAKPTNEILQKLFMWANIL
ncbi:actin-like protein, putative [Plasmodium chabaudi chabaudi]|uniref:Actin-like protein, putative n=1 Tax=Plasmodium chabaudi chabaudi TaxID=31271 RepID=A0A077YFL8_PLACU|nr:actin-like protein, putative [Plasmodium chabaudi chabaudi]SCM01920.1 actin-like protein, putative [Plasmodium chabaudi chabaudi]VTZ66420.1 actin-like protein, putative [Plasmodium chabaudi chabaudi]|eukprot:XP_016655513.1 actin-like protein, putative [Plasmodium chabaudi chabaudi]